MIASNLAQAAVRTAIEYNERHAPTPDQLWAEEQLGLLESRAYGGDAEASYLLARIHQSHERRDAEHWMCEAANVGHREALMQMGHWYNEDRRREELWPYITLSPDNRKAYVYYTLAARRGEIIATAYRDAIAAEAMTAHDIRAAEQRLARWEPVTCPYVVAVREPPRPFDPTER
jgi:TPR repeat protein